MMLLALSTPPGSGGAEDTAAARDAHAAVDLLRQNVQVSFFCNERNGSVNLMNDM